MPPFLITLVAVVAAYLLGSVSFALVAAGFLDWLTRAATVQRIQVRPMSCAAATRLLPQRPFAAT
jgi:hypothetical protein